MMSRSQREAGCAGFRFEVVKSPGQFTIDEERAPPRNALRLLVKKHAEN
jgi:hypothetical protein